MTRQEESGGGSDEVGERPSNDEEERDDPHRPAEPSSGKGGQARPDTSDGVAAGSSVADPEVQHE